MKTFMLFLVMALLIAACGTVSASQGTMISLNPPGVTLLPGSTVTYEISINTLPAGLSRFQMDFQLTNPAAGQITSVSFPSWAKLNNVTSLPAGRVTISAIDVGKAIEDGASGATLAGITVEAVAAGTSNVKLQNIRIDDDHGGYINPDPATVQLVVKQGGISVTSVATTQNTPGTTAPGTTDGVVTISSTVVPVTTLPAASTTPEVITGASNIPSDIPVEDAMVVTPTPTSFIAKIPRWMLYAVGLIALVAGLSLLFLAVTRRI